MINLAIKALKSLLHKGIFKIFLLSILLNIAILAGIVLGVHFLLDGITIPFLEGFDFLIDISGVIIAFFISIFVFPILMPIIISFFDEAICAAIEKQEYPELAKPNPPFWPTIRQDLAFTLKAIFLNILVLPLYLIPLVNIVVYYTLNGYLLGREFFNTAAGRYVSFGEGKALRKRNKLEIITGGAAITFLATIPVIQLIAPIWGVALMLHLFQQKRYNLSDDLIIL
jgi:CysZ protein